MLRGIDLKFELKAEDIILRRHREVVCGNGLRPTNIRLIETDFGKSE